VEEIVPQKQTAAQNVPATIARDRGPNGQATDEDQGRHAR